MLGVVSAYCAAALADKRSIPLVVHSRIHEMIVPPRRKGDEEECNWRNENIEFNGQGRNRRGARGGEDDVREYGEACQNK